MIAILVAGRHRMATVQIRVIRVTISAPLPFVGQRVDCHGMIQRMSARR
jgi:hypothetical protein